MKKITSIFLFIFLISCKNISKGNDEKFKWVNDELIENNSILVLNDSAISLELENLVLKKINISSLISNFSFVQLDQNNLIGAIDKILFDDNFIFVLDKYSTVSISVFDKNSGDNIFNIDSHGNGPEEFNSIYDFDVDFSNEFLYIFDGDRSRYLKYNFKGDFIDSKKLPFRIGNIRKLNSGGFINFPHHAPNKHLGSFFSNKEIIITDDSLNLKYGAFDFNDNVVQNDFYSRDFFSYNQEYFSFFPRFKNEIYVLSNEKSQFIFKSLVKFNLGKYSVEDSDFLKDSQAFIKNRRSDGKLFSFGKHFISENWIGANFKNFKGNPFSVFYSLKDNEIYAGSDFNFDFPGLPVFSFPAAINKSECLSIVNSEMINFFKTMEKSQKEYYIKNGVWNDKIESVINEIEDVEAPVLLFYDLN